VTAGGSAVKDLDFDDDDLTGKIFAAMHEPVSDPEAAIQELRAHSLAISSRTKRIEESNREVISAAKKLGANVYTLEVIEDLSLRAQKTLESLGYSGIQFIVGNGFLGWPKNIKFDAILLSAAPERFPQPLLDQLKEGGRLVGPEGPKNHQWLWRVTRTPQGLVREKISPVKFVIMAEPG
jgi:hypothetical protein